ncbi:MAG: magnesium transporter [Actinobacteria bacterium]|nr:magnesium transporter [Actinomycetota bacterium]
MIELMDLLKQEDPVVLHSWLEDAPANEIADQLARLEPFRRAIPFRLLHKDKAVVVFEEFDPPLQTELIEALKDDSVRQLMEEIHPDDRARLLDEVPAMVAKRLMAGLSPAERALTASLLGYPERSAGRIMTPEYVSLRASMTVQEAMVKVSTQGRGAETIYTLPITDDRRTLVGMTSLRTLVLASMDELVGDLMEKQVVFVEATTDQESAARLVQEANLLAIPVVDSECRLVGLITVDDAMEVIEEEESEDLARTGAAEPLGRPYLSSSVIRMARTRILWLLALVLAATLTVNVLHVFQGTLEKVATLALFIPLLIDTGGNIGSQSATTVVRAMALGEVRFRDLPTVVFREARVGLMLGAMLGVFALLPVSVFVGRQIALVVAITLLVICLFAAAAGAMLPMLARRVGIDPAIVSAPLITTLVDAAGLVVYFLAAHLILGL